MGIVRIVAKDSIEAVYTNLFWIMSANIIEQNYNVALQFQGFDEVVEDETTCPLSITIDE